jgi:hypothetical protein
VKLSKEQGKTANRSACFFVPGRPFFLQETVSEDSYNKAYSNLASWTKNNVSIVVRPPRAADQSSAHFYVRAQGEMS